MYSLIHLITYDSFISSKLLEIKLVDFPVKIDLASDNALLACRSALLVQLDNLEFFFDLEVLFFGTAMCISFYIILF